jgi:hypothetical protein
MTLTANERIRLRVCSAIITRNRRELEWAVTQPLEVIGDELLASAKENLTVAPVPGSYRLVNFTNYLPAWVQYVGQRSVLLFPHLARRLLRSSGLHHQMF